MCEPEDKKIGVTAHYGVPDTIFLAIVRGVPHPADHEARTCALIDVDTVEISQAAKNSPLGANHDVLIGYYRLLLAGRKPKLEDGACFASARQDWPALRQQWLNGWPVLREPRIREFRPETMDSVIEAMRADSSRIGKVNLQRL